MCLNKYRMLNPKFFFACLFFFLSLSESSEAQMNLVPNPSFEIRDSCPDNVGQIYKALGWKSLLISPDYFHVCTSHWRVSIPNNHAGYQIPLDLNDSAYAGFFTSHTNNQSREIIGISLTQPMIIGQEYHFSFYLSAASHPSASPCHSNKVGVKFITYLSSLTASNPNLVDNTSHYFIDSIFSDTSNWHYFKGSFIADSAYTDFLFGNFYTVDNISYFCSYTGPARSYYYVDKVCVSLDSNYCDLVSGILPSKKQDAISIVFAKDGVEIHIIQERFRDMVIYDLSGRMIMKKELTPGINFINYAHLPVGMYLMRIDHYTYKFIR